MRTVDCLPSPTGRRSPAARPTKDCTRSHLRDYASLIRPDGRATVFTCDEGPMPFQYSCFISYAHGQEQLIRRFIDELQKALKSSLEPYLDQQVYIDEERPKAGNRFNPKIARALCESVCMILVYVPKYGQHSYCVREYAAMEWLEEQRRALLGKKLPAERGFIIPIVLRGRHEDLPPKLKGHIHYADFSRYTTASSDIGS